jgi:hypothetical protein
MGEEAADHAAAGLYPDLHGPTGNQNGLNLGTAVVGSTFNQAISNGSGTEPVTIQHITPIPAKVFSGSRQQREAIWLTMPDLALRG